jgi:hypothetical protein
MPLSVIGAGFGRTGTTSLWRAFDRLGFGPCWKEGDSPIGRTLWSKFRSHQPINWDEVLDGYRSTLDFPICLFYRELASHYPTAKVILTVRDTNVWYESTEAVFLKPLFALKESSPERATELTFATDLLSTAFGPDLLNRSAVIAAYERHTAEVQRSISADRLLVYDVGTGWEPLCEFLGVPLPDESFPSLNSRSDLVWKKAPVET